ncbi:MAG: hypothetical protein MJZ66_02830 [Bacteroidales bacterium]|nr:hypothetical protein [Bacteroidales bacterium]
MYKISHKITIDGKVLQLLDSVTISKSVENLVQTATIKLPAIVYNYPSEQIKAIRRGQRVSIMLGYDGDLVEEFAGYVKSTEHEDTGMVITCEDDMYLFNEILLQDKVYEQPSVKTLLKELLRQVDKSYKLDCDYDFSYDKFTIQTATALDVLKLIQQECQCGMYVLGDTLHVHPVYTEHFGDANYNLSANVQADGFSLSYKDAAERRLKVIAKGKDATGKEIEVTEGEAGGDTENFTYNGITTKAQLSTIAKEIYSRKCYSGYEGTFQAWLQPYCSAGFSVNLSNEIEAERSGTYFVKSVETSVSASGGVRKIELGKRL